MKTSSRTSVPAGPSLVLSSLLGLLAACVTGCATAGYQKSDAAAGTMQTAAAEVQAESRALEVTMTTLRNLVSVPQADLKPQFNRFDDALRRLVAAANRVETTGKRMHQKSSAYLQAWDRQLATIDFEHIRALSQTRKAEVSSRFESVNSRYQDTQSVVQPLIAYLQDIRKALSSDLTNGGVQAIKPVAQNADSNSSKVQIALAALSSELTNSSSRMSSIALQTAR